MTLVEDSSRPGVEQEMQKPLQLGGLCLCSDAVQVDMIEFKIPDVFCVRNAHHSAVQNVPKVQ